jgi:nucleoside-diphosphate-sugar epimerase
LARYLITGAAGFIGSHLAHALVARGEQVRALDNFATGQRGNLAGVLDRIDLRLAFPAPSKSHGQATRPTSTAPSICSKEHVPLVFAVSSMQRRRRLMEISPAFHASRR